MINSTILDLTKIQTTYATCVKFTDRQARLETQLIKFNLNFKKYEGQITETQWVGSCQNHKDILEDNMNTESFLVLEDDVVLSENFQTTISYPSGTDAIYLGKSLLFLKESNYNREYTKLQFSFGLHGILYLSSQFREHMLSCFTQSLNNCVICDRLTGDSLKNFKVLSPRKCWLYQDNVNNVHNKLATQY